jgi:hypothetical protein
MYSTQIVLRQLQAANPDAAVTEDKIRHAIRRGLVGPKAFACRLAWTSEDVKKLVSALDLVPPMFDDEHGCIALNGGRRRSRSGASRDRARRVPGSRHAAP